MKKRYDTIDLLDDEEANKQRVRDHDYRMAKVGKINHSSLVVLMIVSAAFASMPWAHYMNALYAAEYATEYATKIEKCKAAQRDRDNE